VKTPKLLNLAGAAEYVDVQSSDGGLHFDVTLEPGIYRLTARLDAREFDWSRLYLNLDLYENKGQRTGPWDFDLRSHNEPLLPAWWMSVNGRRLGLAMPARPGPQAMATKRLNVNVCFEVREHGAVQVNWEPYNDVSGLACVQLQLARAYEQDPDATPPLRNLAKDQADQRIWEKWHATVHAPNNPYTKLMPRLIASAKAQYNVPTQKVKNNDIVKHSPMYGAEALPLLAYAHLAEGDDEALDYLLQGVRGLLDMKAWGNPFEDGYGHNCDMSAAERIEPLTFILHWERDALRNANLYDALHERLIKQMIFFYDAMLLAEDYWGGSLLQDHGHRSIGRFGVAAANMFGECDDAPRWFAFVANRMQRVIEALPNDGGMPFTSYHKIHLFMDDMVTWRQVLQHVTGRDIFDDPKFAQLIRFVVNRLHEPTMQVMTVISRGDRKDFYAGWGFFNAVAEKYDDPDAARLTQILVEHYSDSDREIPIRPISTALAMFEHHPPVGPRPLVPEPFDVRLDSGLVNYRLPQKQVNVAMRCISTPAISSATRTFCPCDRAVDAPLEGHFTVAVGNQTLLLTAEGGYQQRSDLGCVLHIDGKGQYGDLNYSMGIPDMPLRTHCIEAARYSEQDQTAYVRMRLDPAYDRAAQLIRYDREFILKPDGLIVRDIVVSDIEHEYSWHFQTYARRTIDTLSSGHYRIADGNDVLTLKAYALETPLDAAIADTDVVWAYSNENDDQPFRHIRFQTHEKMKTLTAEFKIDWSDSC